MNTSKPQKAPISKRDNCSRNREDLVRENNGLSLWLDPLNMSWEKFRAHLTVTLRICGLLNTPPANSVITQPLHARISPNGVSSVKDNLGLG